MPEATLPDTPSRRAAIMGAGALLAGAALTSTTTAPADADAELLRLCAAYHEANEALQAEFAKGFDCTPGSTCEAAHNAYWAAIYTIEPVRANTFAGLAAKARVLKTDMANTATEGGYDGDPPYAPLVVSLLADCISLGEGVRL